MSTMLVKRDRFKLFRRWLHQTIGYSPNTAKAWAAKASATEQKAERYFDGDLVRAAMADRPRNGKAHPGVLAWMHYRGGYPDQLRALGGPPRKIRARWEKMLKERIARRVAAREARYEALRRRYGVRRPVEPSWWFDGEEQAE